MTSPAPRFAIVGAGGVGGCLGAALARAGFETTSLHEAPIFQAMQRSGLQIEDPDGTGAY
jgi:2-dehydropantoate 2-reductase